MSRCRALAVAAVTAATVALAAPAAVAWDDPNAITVTPRVIARGGQLTITVDAPECASRGGTVSSSAFPTTPLHAASPGSKKVVAEVKVNRDARGGPHDVTVRCGNHTLTKPNAFSVIGGVQGGLGGSSTGSTTTDLAIGSGLVAAAVVGGGVAVLRRQNRKAA